MKRKHPLLSPILNMVLLFSLMNFVFFSAKHRPNGTAALAAPIFALVLAALIVASMLTSTAPTSRQIIRYVEFVVLWLYYFAFSYWLIGLDGFNEQKISKLDAIYF